MKPLARRALGLLLLLLLAGIAAWIFRLALLEQALVGMLLRRGMDSAALEATRLDARGVDLRDVRLSFEDGNLQIDTLDIGFTPSGLWRRRVADVRCTGVQVVFTLPEDPAGPAFSFSSPTPGDRRWQIDRFSMLGASLALRESAESAPAEIVQALEVEATGVSGSGPQSVQANGIVCSNALADALSDVLARWIPAAEKGAGQEAIGQANALPDLAIACEASGEADAIWRIESRVHTSDNLLRADVHSTLNPATGQEHRLDVAVGDLSLLPRIAAAMAPGVMPWDAFTVTGASTVGAQISGVGGRWQVDARCQILGATLKWPSQGVEVEDIDVDVALDSLTPPRTLPRQTIHFAKARWGEIALEQGALQFQWTGPNRITLEAGGFRWCGGTFVMSPFAWDGAAGRQELSFDIEGLDLGRIMAGQGKVKGSAEGTVSGQLRLAFHGSRLVGAQGELHAPDGTRGRLRLADPTLLTRHLPQGDARVRQAEDSLRDLSFSRLDISLTMGEQGPTLTRLYVEGRSATDRKAPPVRLTVNIEADADDLLYLGSLLRRARGSP